jgi:hypothetical protein
MAKDNIQNKCDHSPLTNFLNSKEKKLTLLIVILAKTFMKSFTKLTKTFRAYFHVSIVWIVKGGKFDSVRSFYAPQESSNTRNLQPS